MKEVKAIWCCVGSIASVDQIRKNMVVTWVIEVVLLTLYLVF